MITVHEIRRMHPWMPQYELEGLIKVLVDRGTLEGPPEVPPLGEPEPDRPKRRKYWCDYPHDELFHAYSNARRDHAFLLRCEGLTLQQIGSRIGVTRETARQMVDRTGRKMAKALHKTRWTFDASPDR